MGDTLFSFDACEIGYNHIKDDKVCEDRAGSYDDEKMHICVIADGHGSDNYPRADRGAEFAVNSALECTKDFIENAKAREILSDKNDELLGQLSKSILQKWHEFVEGDFEKDPFSEEDLSAVSDRYRQFYLSAGENPDYACKAYGCTLILFAVTPEYSFGLQIGDGKCVVVDREGNFSEPIPWDDNCTFNITTSICDDNAADEFRFYKSEESPAAVFCGSDGVDDSYANDEELQALYRSILTIFAEHGRQTGQSEILEYLPVLTKKGSGDDVSIAGIMELDRVEELDPIFKVQTEIFNLEEELKKKRSQINSLKGNLKES